MSTPRLGLKLEAHTNELDRWIGALVEQLHAPAAAVYCVAFSLRLAGRADLRLPMFRGRSPDIKSGLSELNLTSWLLCRR